MTNLFSHAFTHKGTVRETNEDAILDEPALGIWAVADGMGGHAEGDYASQLLVTKLQKLASQFQGKALVNQIEEGLTNIHQAIYNYSSSLPGSPIVGSTVVVLILEMDNFHCFWTGDSRCYLYREDSLTQLTQDHTEAESLYSHIKVGERLSQQDILAAENTLTHAIGIDEFTPYVEYVSGHIYEHDTFLLCTDGVTKVFQDAELVNFLRSDNIHHINEEMLSKALRLNATDNLSNILVRI